MNERDLLLYEQIRGELGSPPGPGPVVLDVKTTQFVRMELVVLKALLEGGRPGIFISVDRPHQYMVHLLDMHRIPHAQVTFVDAVARFAADQKQASARVEFLRGPSHIDTLPDMLMRWASESGLGVDQWEFAMIDNLATLLNFNSPAVVANFIKRFVDGFGGRAVIPVVLDRERTPHLFQTILSLGGRELKLNGHSPGGAQP